MTQRHSREATPLVVDAAHCKRCGLCMRACSEGAVRLTPDGGFEIDPARCTRCDACVRVCPARAILDLAADDRS